MNCVNWRPSNDERQDDDDQHFDEFLFVFGKLLSPTNVRRIADDLSLSDRVPNNRVEKNDSQ